MPSNSPFVCVACREVFKQTSVCPRCHEPMLWMSSKWRAPKRSDDRAWASITLGDIWWDKKAVSRSAFHRSPWSKEWREKALEQARRINPKHRRSHLDS